MVRRCVAYGCSHENNNLFGWPSDPVYAAKWDRFVKVRRLNWRSHSSSSQLCFAHFTNDQFANKMQYDAGYCKKLLLKPDAIPTLHTAESSSTVQTSAVQTSAVHVFSPPRPKGRSAYEKRERQRLIKGILSVTEDSYNNNNNPMSDDEESETLTENKHDAATQTDRELHSQGIQTMKIQPTYVYKTKYRYRSVKKPAKKTRHSRGIQFSPVTRDFGTSMKTMKRKGRPLGSFSKTQVLDMSSRESDDEKDDDYMPNSSSDETDDEIEEDPIKFNEMIDESNIPYREQTKFVVTQTALLQLFEKCRVCHEKNIVQKRSEESHLFVKTKCSSCGHSTEWENCPKIRGISVISILLSSVIILTGSLQSKVLRLFSLMGICSMSSRTFFRHQSKYIHRAVASVWAAKQQNLLNEREDSKLIIGGDGRCDSVGHSAKYGIYTIIDIPANKILNMELIQSTETDSSNKMELEGLKRCQKKLKNFKIEAFITDMHLQIAKWVRESWKIPHYYDCWHVVKSLTKKMEKLGKQKGMEVIQDWIKSIKCHLYWCALSTEPGQPDDIKQKWLTCTNHLQNDHSNCYHGTYNHNVKWLVPGTKPCDDLIKLLTKTRIVNQISKMSPFGQTSNLEAFHSLVNQFAPKMIHFSYQGMQSRVAIAIMHWNENSDRLQSAGKNNQLQYAVSYPKYKDGYILRKIMSDATFHYVDEVMEEIFSVVKTCPHKLESYYVHVPPSLSSKHHKVPKEEAIRTRMSRFRPVGIVPIQQKENHLN